MTFPVIFSESGLSPGVSWTVTLGGVPGTSTTGSITLEAPNGTWAYQLSDAPGWRAATYGGSVTVQGGAASVSVEWSPTTYTLTFLETGLPSGQLWGVTIFGSLESSANPAIALTASNGTYYYLVEAVGGWAPVAYSGTVSIRGGSAVVPINWTEVEFVVTFTALGLPEGTGWSVTLGGVASTSSGSAVSFSEPNGSFPFVIGNVSGWAAAAYSGTLTVTGAPVGLSVAWTRVTYRIAFSPSGLAPGTSWSVTLNGNASSTSDAPIVFDVPNGTLVYRISALSGWRTTSYSGKITVDDAPLDLAIAWTPQTYPVTFTESGLPSGTSWSVALNGTLASSSDPTLVLDGINGSLPYVLSDLPGWRAKVYDGTVTVNGGPAGVSVLWTPVTYPVTFTQSDLPDGTTWAVTLGGQTITSANATITFRVANGSYPYTVTAPDGYAVTPAAGTVVVTAAASAQSIGFHARAGGASTFLGLPTSGGLGMLWGALLALLIVALALLVGSRVRRDRRKARRPIARGSPDPSEGAVAPWAGPAVPEGTAAGAETPGESAAAPEGSEPSPVGPSEMAEPTSPADEPTEAAGTGDPESGGVP